LKSALKGCNRKATVPSHQSKGSNSKATIWYPRIAKQGQQSKGSIQRQQSKGKSEEAIQGQQGNKPRPAIKEQQIEGSRPRAANAGIRKQSIQSEGSTPSDNNLR
jgi:hypothetical protein